MPDMPEEIFDLYLEKGAKHGLLGNVTLIGGEPFIDVERLIRFIRKIWQLGAPTYEIFIPTNERWTLRPDWREIAAELASLAQWFPHDLRIAFSRNEWNLAQLGEFKDTVCDRWEALEKFSPSTFMHRVLEKGQVLPLGRAAANGLSEPDKSTGLNCTFDDWYDPGQRLAFARIIWPFFRMRAWAFAIFFIPLSLAGFLTILTRFCKFAGIILWRCVRSLQAGLLATWTLAPAFSASDFFPTGSGAAAWRIERGSWTCPYPCKVF